MSEKLRVLVLGYGEMGHAMDYLLGKRVEMGIWDKFPGPGFQSVVLEDAAPGADIAIFCLPVNPYREVAEHILPHLKDNCICLGIAKGLDEAGQTAAQIFADVFRQRQPYAFLYGPMISEEIRAGRYAFAQVGCMNGAVYEGVRALFAGTPLYLESSTDITGISWSVILKNVYAMVFGMSDELQLGDNMRGYLAVTSLQELDQIVQKMGGKAGSPYHLAGLGDLVTTATSEDSHHHELGRMLARGERQAIKGEGVHTLEMVGKHHLLNEADYPLFSLIREIVRDPRNVEKRIDDFLQRNYD